MDKVKKEEKYINLKFPYYRLYYKFKKRRLKELVKNFKSNIVFEKPEKLKNIYFDKFNNNYFIIIDKWEDNMELNQITDCFSEKNRIVKNPRLIAKSGYYCRAEWIHRLLPVDTDCFQEGGHQR